MSDVTKCPICGAVSDVYDTRYTADGTKRRWRKCRSEPGDHRWRTREIMDDKTDTAEQIGAAVDVLEATVSIIASHIDRLKRG